MQKIRFTLAKTHTEKYGSTKLEYLYFATKYAPPWVFFMGGREREHNRSMTSITC